MLITFRKLAEIAAKSPGYTVLVRDHSGTYEFTNIRFERRSGRIHRAIVLADYRHVSMQASKQGVFDSDDQINILD